MEDIQRNTGSLFNSKDETVKMHQRKEKQMTDRANMIQEKIDDLILYIRSKPVEEMTKTDYDILSAERADIRFQEQQSLNEKRMEQLMVLSSSSNVGISNDSSQK